MEMIVVWLGNEVGVGLAEYNFCSGSTQFDGGCLRGWMCHFSASYHGRLALSVGVVSMV